MAVRFVEVGGIVDHWSCRICNRSQNSKIVIVRLTNERNDVHLWEALFDKACKIASEFEIEASRPPRSRTSKKQSELSCRQPIWLLKNIPIPWLFVSFSGRDIKASSKQRGAFFYLASFLSPADLLTLTPEIVDRLFNAYQTDLQRNVGFSGWSRAF